MIKFIVSALLILSLISSGYSNIDDCGSQTGSYSNVKISGCQDSDKRCILKRNTNASLTIEVTPNKEVTSVKTVVHGIVLGVPIPFVVPNPDGCINSGLTCPLQPNQLYTYVSILPVERKYPKVTVDVKWELKDQNDEDIICLLIPSKIQ